MTVALIEASQNGRASVIERILQYAEAHQLPLVDAQDKVPYSFLSAVL